MKWCLMRVRICERSIPVQIDCREPCGDAETGFRPVNPLSRRQIKSLAIIAGH